MITSHILYLNTEYRTGFRLTIGRRSVYLLLQALYWLFALSCSASFNSALAERRNRFLLLLTLHTPLIPAVNGCFAIICSLSLRCWYWHRAAALKVHLWALCSLWPTSTSSLFCAFSSWTFGCDGAADTSMRFSFVFRSGTSCCEIHPNCINHCQHCPLEVGNMDKLEPRKIEAIQQTFEVW